MLTSSRSFTKHKAVSQLTVGRRNPHSMASPVWGRCRLPIGGHGRATDAVPAAEAAWQADAPHLVRSNGTRARVRVAIEHLFAGQKGPASPGHALGGRTVPRPSSGSPTSSPHNEPGLVAMRAAPA
jgi:hypothetical protein